MLSPNYKAINIGKIGTDELLRRFCTPTSKPDAFHIFTILTALRSPGDKSDDRFSGRSARSNGMHKLKQFKPGQFSTADKTSAYLVIWEDIYLNVSRHNPVKLK